MITKIHAAEIAMDAGIDMIIANGTRPELLYKILDGDKVGTKFIGRKKDDNKRDSETGSHSQNCDQLSRYRDQK